MTFDRREEMRIIRNTSDAANEVYTNPVIKDAIKLLTAKDSSLRYKLRTNPVEALTMAIQTARENYHKETDTVLKDFEQNHLIQEAMTRKVYNEIYGDED